MRSTTARVVFSLVVAAGLLAAPLASAPASAVGSLTLEATYTSVNNGWAKVERWRDADANFPQEAYPADGRGDQDGDRLTYFGGVTKPHSSRFLMYYAPKWSTGTKATPVLLVHGLNQNADQAWANPSLSLCGESICPITGMMQQLDAAGYKVFALNFAHKHGDNYLQAQIVGNAIQVIKSQLGVSAVDVIGWSKGVFASRMYASSVKPSWGRAYQNDIRKLVLMAGPNNGYDYGFRHGTLNYSSVYSECSLVNLNGPVASGSYNCGFAGGPMYSHPELGYLGTGADNVFPGTRQMVKAWDATYSIDSLQPDATPIYYGGTGTYTLSPGIASVVSQHSIVDTVRNAGVPSSIATYELCGSSPTIFGLYNENTGPSDGVLFVSSCRDTVGIPNVTGSTLAYNHLNLGWRLIPVATIKSWLG